MQPRGISMWGYMPVAITGALVECWAHLFVVSWLSCCEACCSVVADMVMCNVSFCSISFLFGYLVVQEFCCVCCSVLSSCRMTKSNCYKTSSMTSYYFTCVLVKWNLSHNWICICWTYFSFFTVAFLPQIQLTWTCWLHIVGRSWMKLIEARSQS